MKDKILTNIWKNKSFNEKICSWLYKKGVVVIHAAAVVCNNHCYVFLGNSGIGKTTLSKIYYNYFGPNTVLSDDLIAIKNSYGHISIYGTPWIGKKTKKEKEWSTKLCSKTIITTKTHNVHFFELFQGKSNYVYPEPQIDRLKAIVLLHSLWGNKMFVEQQEINYPKNRILRNKINTMPKYLQYPEHITLLLRIMHKYQIKRLRFEKSTRIIMYLNRKTLTT